MRGVLVGAGVLVGVEVLVGDNVGVGVEVLVGDNVGVGVDVLVIDGVGVGVGVPVVDNVGVGVRVGSEVPAFRSLTPASVTLLAREDRFRSRLPEALDRLVSERLVRLPALSNSHHSTW
jgi:hypothetical protein